MTTRKSTITPVNLNPGKINQNSGKVNQNTRKFLSEYDPAADENLPVRQEIILVNLNAADSVGLREVRGIGPVLSKRIVKYRYLIGGFIDKSQMLEVYGIGDDNYDLIASQVFIDTSIVRYIDINTTGYEELNRHPYLNSFQSRAIISFREGKGSFTSVSQLDGELLIPEEVFRKIAGYLKIE